MRFVCGKCQTRYTVPDEKARGKALKVRCKKCGNVISLRPEAAPSPEPAPEAQESTQMVDVEQLRRLQAEIREPAAASSPRVVRSPPAPKAEVPPPSEDWYAMVGGQQLGPFSRAQL
ncbi:MAG: zinc-ribbon domain-containing protein, partial [Deltaproteobacteria bacterium]